MQLVTPESSNIAPQMPPVVTSQRTLGISAEVTTSSHALKQVSRSITKRKHLLRGALDTLTMGVAVLVVLVHAATAKGVL